MTDLEYKEFIKRYEKFKDCNLPVRYWDEERQTLEYVHYENKDNFEEWRNYNISDSLFYSLSNIAFTGLYYSFNCGGYIEENGEWVKKVEHNHAHSFEEVVRYLYDYPESFSISKDEEEFYSKQELKYLRRVQKYLLFIGLKDIGAPKYDENGDCIFDYSRHINKLQDKYRDCRIITCEEATVKSIDSGDKKYFIFSTSYPEFYKDEDKMTESALIVDEQDNFKFYIKYSHYKKCLYKDIMDAYVNDDLNPEDVVILKYFDVVENY